MFLRLLTLFLVCSTNGFAGPALEVLQRFSVKGPTGSWDFVTVDSEARVIYLAHATQVEVMNADTGEPIGVIPDTPGVHGVAVARQFKRGFVTNGKDDSVTIFDTESLKTIRKISVGKGPDPIYFDAASGRIFTGNHGSGDITAIDAATGEIAGSIPVDGECEFMVTGADGLIYANLEDKNQVVVFDPSTLEIKRKFPIPGGADCTGLAIDRANNRLFSGCRNQVLVVIDAASGKAITTFPIGPSVDGVEFDSERKRIYASTTDGILTVIRQVSADQYEADGLVKTHASGKTMALDSKSHNVYVPAADVKETPDPEPGKRPVRVQTPGTLFIYLIGLPKP